MREEEGKKEDEERKRENVERNMKGGKDLATRVKELGRRLMHGQYKCLFHECEKMVRINKTQHLREHALVHYNGPSLFKCKLCAYRTNALPGMWQHARIAHGITSQTNGERPYVDLRTHKSAKICNTLILRCFGAHGEDCEKLRTVKCRICSSRVRSAHNHADIHLSPPGIYRCSSCDREFNHHIDIKRHLAQCTVGARIVSQRNTPEVATRLAALREKCFPKWNWHHRLPKKNGVRGRKTGKQGGEKSGGHGRKSTHLTRAAASGDSRKETAMARGGDGEDMQTASEGSQQKAGGGDEKNGRHGKALCFPRQRSAEQ